MTFLEPMLVSNSNTSLKISTFWSHNMSVSVTWQLDQQFMVSYRLSLQPYTYLAQLRRCKYWKTLWSRSWPFGVTWRHWSGDHSTQYVVSYRWSIITICLHCVPKNAPTLKPYNSKLYFDEIWHKYSKYSRIEFSCFSFHIGLLFINFSSFKPDTENNANYHSW